MNLPEPWSFPFLIQLSCNLYRATKMFHAGVEIGTLMISAT